MHELVSIVLPVYNGEKYLAQSIESVLNQTYKNIELIIVNDCSTDSSESIILKYKEIDTRIVYLKNEVNSKLPQSLNNGFSVARGDYFTWTSDDNIFHNNAIEVMVEYLKNNNNISLVYCDYRVIDEDGNFCYDVNVENKQYLIFRNVIGACFLYSSYAANKIGNYNVNYFLVEDYEYWLRINLYFDILPIHICLYDYRLHKNSLTATKKNEIKNALKKLHWNYLSIYERNAIHEDELIRYFDFILSYITKRRKRFSKELFFAIRHRKYFNKLLKKLSSKLSKIFA